VADPVEWQCKNAFAAIARDAGQWTGEPGLIARPLTNLALATVLARKGRRQALAERIRAVYGLTAPDGPRRAAVGALALVATAPGAWLAVDEAGGPDWAEDLVEALEGLASVSDQSHGYAKVRLEGPAVLDVLAKGPFLDLHPSAFPIGAAAVTDAAHMGLILWRRELLAFDVLCFRSYASSLWVWLEESAAEFGLKAMD
jgi:heterotetrameric sarcosine oxidase gamma subunit